jgi:hypothetical protein
MDNSLEARQKIEKLEGELNISLPAPYKKFLSSHNVGVYERTCFDFLDTDGNVNSSTINNFLFPESDGRYDLRTTYKFYSDADRIPLGLLPVAKDFAGNLVCICVEGKDIGKVYYWDHELEFDVAGYEDLAFLAPDFASFLSMLAGSKREN